MKYFITDLETGENREVSKEEKERYNATIKNIFPAISINDISDPTLFITSETSEGRKLETFKSLWVKSEDFKREDKIEYVDVQIVDRKGR